MSWRTFRFVTILAWWVFLAVHVRGDEDELISVQLEPSCTLIGGCAECQGKEGISECAQTGFTQQYECGEKVNATSGEETYFYRNVACVPPMAGWMEIVRFDLIALVLAIISLLFVRSRKQMAAYNLVSLVNRS